MLGLENSSRAAKLLKWNDTGDLSSIIHNIVSDSVHTVLYNFLYLNYKEHVIAPNLTISRIDALIQRLSDVGKSSQGKETEKMKSILCEIYLSMTSIEAKWITRIILKNLMLSIEPKLFFDAFHGW